MNDTQEIQREIGRILSLPFDKSEKEICTDMLSYIDLTALDGTDTREKISRLCRKAIDYGTAAVCVYPFYAKQVCEALHGSGIKTACVAGGFPASQLPLEVKLFEVKRALEDGADEIDMVISQGAFLEGDFDRVGKEIRTIKDVCGERHLKVILETGNLQSPDNIEKASCIAIENGADFIKTSTGKTSVSATLEAFYVMLKVIERYAGQGKMVGIKPAGGISTVEAAIPYYRLVRTVLGEKWMNPGYFRIGASRLADALKRASE